MTDCMTRELKLGNAPLRNETQIGSKRCLANGYSLSHLGGRIFSDHAGKIRHGQIVSVELDADAGTLKFWVDGKQHGPGWSSGVKGRLRWATSVLFKSNSVQIVPTPELEAWKLEEVSRT